MNKEVGLISRVCRSHLVVAPLELPPSASAGLIEPLPVVVVVVGRGRGEVGARPLQELGAAEEP